MSENKDKPTELEQVLPQDILTEMLEASKYHSVLSIQLVEGFEFYGKTLAQHSFDLRIDVPKKASEITPEIYRDLHLKVIANIQKASHYLGVANSITQAMAGGNTQRKSALVNSIIQDYQRRNAKRPAMDGIEHMADSKLSDIMEIQTAAKIVKEFWKIRLDSLIDVRKSLEQIGISMTSELKYLDHS